MSFISRYIAYLKHNPEGYWFKRKAYGWGWVPARWQGWVAVAAFIAVFVWIYIPFVETAARHALTQSDVALFVVKIIVWGVALFAMCYYKGEPPKWQWGIPESDTE